MTARILVVDDVLPNVKVLEAKLSAEYYDVLTAFSGPEALEVIHRDMPDLVLLDVMMPGMDGFEVCRRIKNDPAIAHIPVVMVTALSEPADKIQGLEAGADDFLTKPVDDISLFARVKSLLRLKMTMDELRMREQTSTQFGVTEAFTEISLEVGPDVRVLVIEDNETDARNLRETLSSRYQVTVEGDGAEALILAKSGDYDLVVVSMTLANMDPLRLCSQLRTTEETRHAPIIILVDEGDKDRLLKALEIGVNDYIMRPTDRNELLARALTQVRRKRYQDRLRDNYVRSMSMAVTDGLTDLFNRRYFASHIENLMKGHRKSSKPISVLLIDIDHFKQVNDTYGHAVGDEVLREFAERIKRNVRGIDLPARFGGEEFVVVMPDTDVMKATRVAERLRTSIEEQPFSVSAADVGELNVTCSIGVSATRPEDTVDDLVRRADEALYEAKGGGRNRVCVAESDQVAAGLADTAS